MATKTKMGPIYKGTKFSELNQVIVPLRITDVVRGESVEELGEARILVRGELSLTSEFLASQAIETLKGLLEPRDTAVVYLQSREEPVLVTFYSRSNEYREEIDEALLCWRDHAYQQTEGPYTPSEWVGTWVYEGDLLWDENRKV